MDVKPPTARVGLGRTSPFWNEWIACQDQAPVLHGGVSPAFVLLVPFDSSIALSDPPAPIRLIRLHNKRCYPLFGSSPLVLSAWRTPSCHSGWPMETVRISKFTSEALQRLDRRRGLPGRARSPDPGSRERCRLRAPHYRDHSRMAQRLESYKGGPVSGHLGSIQSTLHQSSTPFSTGADFIQSPWLFSAR